MNADQWPSGLEKPADQLDVEQVSQDADDFTAYVENYWIYASTLGERGNFPIEPHTKAAETMIDLLNRVDKTAKRSDIRGPGWIVMSALGCSVTDRDAVDAHLRYRAKLERQDGSLYFRSEAALGYAAGQLVAPIAYALKAQDEKADALLIPDRKIDSMIEVAMHEVRAAQYSGLDRPDHPQLEILECMRRARGYFEREEQPKAVGRTESLLERWGASGFFWRADAARISEDILNPRIELPSPQV